MISSKDSKEVGNREHHAHSGIYVAFQLWFAAEKEWRVFISFPIRFFWNFSIEMKRRVAVTQSSSAPGMTMKKTRSANKIQKQRDKGYKRIEKFNSNKEEQQQQRNIAARLPSSNLVTLITQEYMTLQSVLRTLQSIQSMQALLQLQSLSILKTMSTPRCLKLRHEESIYILVRNFRWLIRWLIYDSINRLLPPPPPCDPI